MKYFFLFLIIILAQAEETVTGFGATAISLGLGSYLFSLKEMVIALAKSCTRKSMSASSNSWSREFCF